MDEAEELDDASNAVVALIEAGRLDEAEQAAHALLVNYPEVHDGHDRLGMVYEARGLPREAADSYRQVVAFIRAHPDNHDLEMETFFLDRIARLDPPATG
jgi:tetratricopeptide (TPR) repeat protein